MRFLLLVPLLAAGADPDFSGTWHLDASRSDAPSRSLAPPTTLKIQQQGIAVACEAVFENGPEKCSYTIDRKERPA